MEHFVHLSMSLKEFGGTKSVLHMNWHADMESFQAAKDRVAVRGRTHGSESCKIVT